MQYPDRTMKPTTAGCVSKWVWKTIASQRAAANPIVGGSPMI